jgi:[protein-PII] uridylyltransferase
VGGKVFAVREGLIEILDQNALADRAIIFSLLTDAGRAGVPLSRRSERTISYIMKHPELPVKNPKVSWAVLRDLLATDYPGIALRPMQRLGLLAGVLPEFARIDSLVVRDFYHRYTVDEHSMRAIEHLQELAAPPDARGNHFQALWKTVERRDLLIFALLLHDVGKAMTAENVNEGSLEALESAAERLQLSATEKEEVRFLIKHQTDMAATVQRRDIFDPGTIATFATTVGTQERLQRLCLFTYADIHAVNPEALTPWKAEMLWQLYSKTANYFSHTLDSDRLHASDERTLLEQIRENIGDGGEQLETFLEGFPRRYMAMHSAAEIAGHFALYRELGKRPIQIVVKTANNANTLTLMTQDRPQLFATLASVLANQGMNIVTADAFANAAGIVLDTFRFTDLQRTLEQKPKAAEQFEQRFVEAIDAGTPMEPRVRAPQGSSKEKAAKGPEIESSIYFDDKASEHSTLLEIVTKDRPGLLYDISSTLVRLGCNIEVALIDTEGQKAIDVFYLTDHGKKLSSMKQESLREMLYLAVEAIKRAS